MRISLYVCIASIVLFFLLARIPYVQTKLANRLASIISEKTNSEISINKLSFSFFDKIVLEDVFVSDSYKDTLIYIGEMEANIKRLRFRTSNFLFDEIKLKDPYLKIVAHTDSTLSIFTFIDSLTKENPDTTKSSYYIHSPRIVLENGRFVYLNDSIAPVKHGMNYDDLDFYDINGEVLNLRNVGDTIKMDVKNTSCKEKSGLVAKNMDTSMEQAWGFLRFNNSSIQTENSHLLADHLIFNYIPQTRSWQQFTSKMQIDYLFTQPSQVSFEDIALFNSNFMDYTALSGSFTGHLTGTIRSLTCRNMDMKILDKTRFVGDARLNGLPYISETFVEARINSFQTSLDDLEKIKIPNYEKEYFTFPQNAKNIGLIDYQGNFTGFLFDFVFYGHFQTELGLVKTDILLKPNTRNNILTLKGAIATNGFQLGKMLGIEKLGEISMNLDVLNGEAKEGNASIASMKGVVNRLSFYDYDYENLSFNATFSNKVFDGKLQLKDPNIDFEFEGKIDALEEIPVMNFTSKLRKANLNALNLNFITKDSLANLAFNATIDLGGGEIDKLEGGIKLFDSRYANSRGTLKISSLSLNTRLQEDIRSLEFASDFMDASAKGNYKLSEFPSLLDKILSNYVSSSAYKLEDSIRNERTDLAFHFKDLTPINNLFTPGYTISRNAKAFGFYQIGDTTEVEFNLDAKGIIIANRIFSEVKMQIAGDEKVLKINGNADALQVNNHFDLKNLAANLVVAENNMRTQLSWDNQETPNYSGSLKASTDFLFLDSTSLISTQILPTSIQVDTNIWQIAPSTIVAESGNLAIDNFRIKNGNQYLEVFGLISNKPEDFLSIDIHDFDLKNLLGLGGIDQNMLAGHLTGQAEISNILGDPSINTEMDIPDLLLYDKNIGNAELKTGWNQQQKRFDTQLRLSHNKANTFDLKGFYQPSSLSPLNYTVDLKQFDVNYIAPYLSNYVSNLSGALNGQMRIAGSTEKPLMNGVLSLDSIKMRIIETGVQYFVHDKIRLTSEKIMLQDFMIFDDKNDYVTLNGYIIPDFQQDHLLNFNLKADNFKIISEQINNLAYGDASISADLEFVGNTSDLNLKGNVKVIDESKIIIPLNTELEATNSDFITFINPKDTVTDENIFGFLPSKHAKTTNFNYDVGVRLDPTTEIQVLFESKAGSILKSKGNADLQIFKNSEGKQQFFGEYTINRGSFMYTLQNIVNKKFELEEGGTIKWNGSPNNAFADIYAVYKVKTSIDALLENPSNRISQTMVNLKIHLTGRVEDPRVEFDIDFPNLDRSTASTLKTALQNTDQIRQVLSLLVFNRFVTPEYLTKNGVNANAGSSALGVTTSELLSSQLSKLVSQVSDKLDIGVVYKVGDEINNEELGLAVSTELINNRIVISGNFGFESDESRFNDFAGDVDIDFKIDHKGKLRLRAFTHAEDNLYYYENRKNTQGIGLVFKEQFDSFGELLKKYKQALFGSKKQEEKEEKQDNKEVN